METRDPHPDLLLDALRHLVWKLVEAEYERNNAIAGLTPAERDHEGERLRFEAVIHFLESFPTLIPTAAPRDRLHAALVGAARGIHSPHFMPEQVQENHSHSVLDNKIKLNALRAVHLCIASGMGTDDSYAEVCSTFNRLGVRMGNEVDQELSVAVVRDCWSRTPTSTGNTVAETEIPDFERKFKALGYQWPPTEEQAKKYTEALAKLA